MGTDCSTKKQETKQGRYLIFAIIGLTIVFFYHSCYSYLLVAVRKESLSILKS